MSREEQQVSKAKEHTNCEKYGGAENGRKRNFFVSSAESFSCSHKAFGDLKGKQVEVVRDHPNGATCNSGCHPMCDCTNSQSYGFPAVHPISYNSFDSCGSLGYSAPGYWYGAAGIGCSGYKSYGCRKVCDLNSPLTMSEAESFSCEDSADSCGSSGYSAPGYWYGAAGIGCSGYKSYGGPAGVANGNPAICDAGFGRGSPGPSGFWYNPAGIGFGYGSCGGAGFRHGGPAVAPNENPSVCNDGYGRAPPGAGKNVSEYGQNQWGAGCSGYGETLESYENPGKYSAVGGRFGSGKGKRSAGGEIKNGDRAQMNGSTGQDN